MRCEIRDGEDFDPRVTYDVNPEDAVEMFPQWKGQARMFVMNVFPKNAYPTFGRMINWEVGICVYYPKEWTSKRAAEIAAAYIDNPNFDKVIEETSVSIYGKGIKAGYELHSYQPLALFNMAIIPDGDSHKVYMKLGAYYDKPGTHQDPPTIISEIVELKG